MIPNSDPKQPERDSKQCREAIEMANVMFHGIDKVRDPAVILRMIFKQLGTNQILLLKIIDRLPNPNLEKSDG